jgi:hypothetical protein
VPLRLKRLLRRVRDVFPCTGVGLVVIAGASLALLHYGLNRLDLVLLVVGAVGLGLAAIAVVSTTLTALFLWLALRKIKRDSGDVRLECGFLMTTGFSVRNFWFIPFVSVTWTWVEPQARVETVKRRGRLHEQIVPLRRALADKVVRRFEVADIFGLCRIAFHAEQERSVHFVPSVGRLKQMDVVHSMAGGEELSHPDGPPEGERIDIRSYQSTDPIRFVLWKVFARTRQVVVRTPERAIGPVRQTVAYLVSGDGDEPGAGAARVAVEAGCLGGSWVLGADGSPEASRNRDDALASISRSSATAEDEQGSGLKAFLTAAVPGTQLARALVFVPAIPGPWLERVVAQASGSARPGHLEFIVCCDGLVRPGVVTRVARVLREPEEPANPSALLPATLGQLSEVLRQLARTRCKILIIDRQTGLVYSEGHLRQMLRAA